MAFSRERFEVMRARVGPTAIVDAQVSNMPLADGRSEGARGTDPGALYRYTALIFDVTLSVE